MQALDKLYDVFFEPSKQISLQKEIQEYHQNLISTLSKTDRKYIIRIIDAKDLISCIHKKESFICGFKLALELSEELKYQKNSDYISEIEVKSLFSMEVKNEHN